jgi:hypothetical protein
MDNFWLYVLATLIKSNTTIPANISKTGTLMGEFKQTTQKSHRILSSVTLLCSHQIILFEPIV